MRRAGWGMHLSDLRLAVWLMHRVPYTARRWPFSALRVGRRLRYRKTYVSTWPLPTDDAQLVVPLWAPSCILGLLCGCRARTQFFSSPCCTCLSILGLWTWGPAPTKDVLGVHLQVHSLEMVICVRITWCLVPVSPEDGEPSGG